MKYQIAEMQIVKSDFYRNLDTTEIAKSSTATCPHKHVFQVIQSKLNAYAIDLADGRMSLQEIEVHFYVSVLLAVSSNV